MVSLCAAACALALCAPGEPVLLDFYADWCGPCRQMAPVVEDLAARGYPVRKVNVDQHPETAARFRVTSIPCFVLVVEGREVGRLVGRATPAELAQMFHYAKGGEKSAAPQAQLASEAAAQTTPRCDAEVSAGSNAQAAPVRAAGGTPLPSDALDQRLVAATVRLRVADADGRSCGTGTIIDARQGEALILTCGHLFRDSQGQGRIEVDLFGPQAAQALPGRLIAYNLERDVALLSIRTPGPVVAARVASRAFQLAPGQEAISVGCNHGQAPTVVHSRITSIDRYLGPPNIQVAGQSVEGRSGGGIFSAEGLLVGVCNAAEPQDNESFCAGLAAIHQQLDEAGLAFVYDESQLDKATLLAAASGMPAADVPPLAAAPDAPADRARQAASAVPGAPEPAMNPGPPVPVGPLAPASPIAGIPSGQWSPEPGRRGALGSGELSNEAPPSPEVVGSENGSVLAGRSQGSHGWGRATEPGEMSSGPSSGAAPVEALVEQIHRHLDEGAELVCVIRAPGAGSAAPQVIALPNASPALIEQLAACARQDRQLTSLALPAAKEALAPGDARGAHLAPVQPPRPRPARPIWMPPHHPGVALQQ